MATAPRSSLPGTPALARATLEQFRRGDAQAFAAVVRRYAPLVRGAVGRYFQGAFDREEAMQEIWMHLYRHRQAFDLERAESFSGWLAVLARRRCIDLLRQPVDPARPGDDDEATALAWLAAPPAAESSAARGELALAVAAFKAKLEPSWRELFQLHFVEGLAYAEICDRLSIGKLRCKYMRSVLAARARRDRALMAALGRDGGDAS